MQACPHPGWFYIGDDDASRLGCGLEFSPDHPTMAWWLELAMEEMDPAVAFLPEGVHPQCEDPDRDTMLCLHPVLDDRGLAHLPPPPPPGEDWPGARRRRPP